jgi:type III pantothenate kinase
MSELNLIAISVGNSRTQLGQFVGAELRQHEHLDNDSVPAIVQRVVERWEQTEEPRSMLLASVNDAVGKPLNAALADQLSVEIYHVGDDVPVPIGRALDPETITGVDRLLNAAAAWERTRQACIVVDAGTAITIDFVDGEGTFHGGAIMPGAAVQLQSLHDRTAALPELQLTAPDDTDPFGRSTSQAMIKGVFHGIRGGVQRLVEQYAEHYGAFPQIIATGGDAETLFKGDELIDKIVTDLTMQGIAATARHALAADGAEGPDGGS